MTKKDYEKIARAISVTRFTAMMNDLDAEDTMALLVLNLSYALWKDNDKFSLDKFASACYAVDSSQ